MAAELLEEDEEQSAARARQRDAKRRKKEAQKGKLKQGKCEARAESVRRQLLVGECQQQRLTAMPSQGVGATCALRPVSLRGVLRCLVSATIVLFRSGFRRC